MCHKFMIDIHINAREHFEDKPITNEDLLARLLTALNAWVFLNAWTFRCLYLQIFEPE